jgi:LacI family transcriptional regulator
LEVNYLDTDNFSGAQAATDHLLRLGHKRVGTITGPENMIPSFDRLQGYREALRNRNMSFLPELVQEGDFSEQSGYSCMQNLIARRVDAVFAASDAMAYGAMRAIRESGLNIPGDIAVVGFDDLPGSAKTNPALTSVRQPIYRLGYHGTETLVDIIQHPESQPRHVILPTELVIRETCGAH